MFRKIRHGLEYASWLWIITMILRSLGDLGRGIVHEQKRKKLR